MLYITSVWDQQCEVRYQPYQKLRSNRVNERDIEPIVVKETNQFVSFNFGKVQLLDLLKLLGSAVTLDSVLKKSKAEMKRIFPYEWINHPDKMNKKELPPNETFHHKLRKCSVPEREYPDYEKLMCSALTTGIALVKMRLPAKASTREENCFYLQKVWEQEKMLSFEDFLRRYKNDGVVAKVEARQKNIKFIHIKGIDMLKLECTLPNLANISPLFSTRSNFYPFTETDKDLLSEVREDMVGGQSIVF